MSYNYSSSQLQTMKDCALKFYLAHEVGLRKREDESSEHAKRYGFAFHEALRLLYLGDTLTAAKEAFQAAYPVQLDPNDKARTQANGLFTLEAYARHWAAEDKKWRVITVEEPETREDGIIVHLDLVVEHREHGELYVVDHKTTAKYLNFDYFAQFEPNSQVTHYVDHVQRKYGSCGGFIVNAISFRHRSRAYKQEPAGFYCSFERQMFNVSQERIEQERASTAYWINAIEQARESRLWGFNTHNCRFCDYRQMCAAGWAWPDDAELIELTYRRVCNRLTESLRSCQLDRGHTGPHSEHYSAELETVITVDY